MTNPGNAIGTNGAYGGRTSVKAFNDVLATASGRGIVSGWQASPYGGLTITLGGSGTVRDVAIAEDDTGNRTTVNNISEQPVNITLPDAPTIGQRIDAIVAYVNNPPENDNQTIDNPEACGLIVVSSDLAETPVPPTDQQIRTVITADGGSGVTAYYVVLASVLVLTGATDIVNDNISGGDPVGGVEVDDALSATSKNPVQNRVITQALGDISTVLGEVNDGLEQVDVGEGVQIAQTTSLSAPVQTASIATAAPLKLNSVTKADTSAVQEAEIIEEPKTVEAVELATETEPEEGEPTEVETESVAKQEESVAEISEPVSTEEESVANDAPEEAPQDDEAEDETIEDGGEE